MNNSIEIDNTTQLQYAALRIPAGKIVAAVTAPQDPGLRGQPGERSGHADPINPEEPVISTFIESPVQPIFQQSAGFETCERFI